MDWHSNACYLCLDTFNIRNPRLFFHNCIHAICRDCLETKLLFYDKKKVNIFNIKCDYGRCNKPILREALNRNMNIHKINETDSVYIYDYSSYDIPNEINLITKDKLQEIMIKSKGLQTGFINENIRNTIKLMRNSIN